MEGSTVKLEFTQDEAEFLMYLVRKESLGLLSDMEAILVKSLIGKLK